MKSNLEFNDYINHKSKIITHLQEIVAIGEQLKVLEVNDHLQDTRKYLETIAATCKYFHTPPHMMKIITKRL